MDKVRFKAKVDWSLKRKSERYMMESNRNSRNLYQQIMSFVE